jgi:hypothetical protein
VRTGCWPDRSLLGCGITVSRTLCDTEGATYNGTKYLSRGFRRGGVTREEDDGRSTGNRFSDSSYGSVPHDAPIRHGQTRPIIVRVRAPGLYSKTRQLRAGLCFFRALTAQVWVEKPPVEPVEASTRGTPVALGLLPVVFHAARMKSLRLWTVFPPNPAHHSPTVG